ncbi:MAG: hypothetical protein KAS72_10680 [Phycisphaerales bacterium]|nr:hypothetical protein [Phycisphaerales bacterium]
MTCRLRLVVLMILVAVTQSVMPSTALGQDPHMVGLTADPNPVEIGDRTWITATMDGDCDSIYAMAFYYAPGRNGTIDDATLFRWQSEADGDCEAISAPIVGAEWVSDGYVTLLARARWIDGDGIAHWTNIVSVEVQVAGQPCMTDLTADPNPVEIGERTWVTATMDGDCDAIYAAAFYYAPGRNGTIDDATLFRWQSEADGDCEAISAPIVGAEWVSDGYVTLLARARWIDGGGIAHWTNIVSVEVQVTGQPCMTGLTADPNPVEIGDRTWVTATMDGDCDSIYVMAFYYAPGRNGTIDDATLFRWQSEADGDCEAISAPIVGAEWVSDGYVTLLARARWIDGGGIAHWTNIVSVEVQVTGASTWAPLGSGTDGSVWALTEYDDGAGPSLYVGGEFTTAGGESAAGIARWDGSAWSSVSDGTNGAVWALTAHDDGTGEALYVGGFFSAAGGESANSIAAWDGNAWSSLGDGVNGSIRALATFDDGMGDALYAGGLFTMAGGASANGIARWNGSTWSAVGSGMNGTVYVLTVFDDGSGPALFAGGHFTTAGGQAALRIAKWDGSTWTPLGNGTNDAVRALAVFDDGTGPALYVGGWFTTADGQTAARIAKWDGATWTPLGAGMNAPVFALTVPADENGSALYAGGDFTTADGETANYIARWDGSTWSNVDGGMNDGLQVLMVYDDGTGPALHAGGRFTTAGGASANHVACWHTGAKALQLPSGVLYVRSGADPNGDGLSWSHAINDLHDALTIAADPNLGISEVWVAAGTYAPAGAWGDRSAGFELVDGVAIYGGFAGHEMSLATRDSVRNPTVLSGDLNGDDIALLAGSTLDNVYHVVTAADVGPTTVLDGFIIRGGLADGGGAASCGGGMVIRRADPSIVNCIFEDNAAANAGGAVNIVGASTPWLVNCTFRGNRSWNGGAVNNASTMRPHVVNCVFAGNTADALGGAIHNTGGLAVTQCTITGNTAGNLGGGVYTQAPGDDPPTAANCIIWGNRDSLGYGELSQLNDATGSIDIRSCCIEGWTGTYGGTGNFAGDPMFVDPIGADGRIGTADDDLHLDDQSVCIDAGDAKLVPCDLLDLDGDGDQAEPIPYDRDGAERNCDGDANGIAAPDLGAYEHACGSGSTECLGDIDGDRDVDQADLAILLSAYESVQGSTQFIAAADLDRDGDVDQADLAALLSAFGHPCDDPVEYGS